MLSEYYRVQETVAGPVKIALYEITSTVSFGGIQTFVWGMARALAERGHTVHIYGGEGDIRAASHKNIQVLTFPYISRRKMPNFGSRFRKLGERISFNISSFRKLAAGNYDLIYINKPYDLLVALAASKVSKAISVFGSGGTEFFPGYKLLVRRLDLFLACSEYNATVIESYCGVRPSVLYNGIDTAVFAPRPADGDLRRLLGIGNDQPVLLSACRLVGWKGIQYALRAIAVLSKNYNLKYIVIGLGEYGEELKALAQELGIEDRVVFTGAVRNSDLPGYYSLADVAVFPSVADETFGISIAEAMSCGVPVVSTKVGGIPEVVAESTGLLVPPRDADALGRAVETFLADGTLRRETGVRARAWIMEQFSWPNIAARFEALLKSAERDRGKK